MRVVGRGISGCLNSAGGRAVPGDSIQDVDQGFLQVVPPPLANTLTARMHKGINTTCDEGQTLIPEIVGGFDAVPFDTTQITSPGNYSNPRSGDACHPLTACGDPPTIAFGGQMSVPQVDFELSQTLQAKNPQAVAIGWRVRRITPVEAERLQGFPDNYTAIPWRRRPADQCPDGPRYKALGNSMAEPVMNWLGRRIDAVRAITDGR